MARAGAAALALLTANAQHCTALPCCGLGPLRPSCQHRQCTASELRHGGLAAAAESAGWVQDFFSLGRTSSQAASTAGARCCAAMGPSLTHSALGPSLGSLCPACLCAGCRLGTEAQQRRAMDGSLMTTARYPALRGSQDTPITSPTCLGSLTQCLCS